MFSQAQTKTGGGPTSCNTAFTSEMHCQFDESCIASHLIAGIEEVHSLQDEMLDKGVVEQSKGPRASPVVLIQKQDGSTQFCVNYQLNAARTLIHYHAQIDNTLDMRAGSLWFSMLDLLNGYRQVEIDKTDPEKTFSV